MFTALVRRLSYHPVVAGIVRRLHLQSPARRAYHRFFAQAGGVWDARCCGISARFHVPDAHEFRTIELALVSERPVLEGVLRALDPGDVLWDIGSNRGLFTIFGATRVGPAGRVFSFEPERGCYAKLLANVDLNGLKNVHSMNVALSDRERLGLLARAAPDGLSQASQLVETATPETETVEVREGDTLGLPPPNVVKIDVEGHEHHVLRGLRKTLAQRDCRALFCEIHADRQPSGVSVDAVCNLIRDLGFTNLQEHGRGLELQVAARKDAVGASREAVGR